LHELRERKGPAPGKKSASGFGHSLEGTRAADSDRRHRRKSFERRIGTLFSFAADWQPAWSVGFASERSDRRTTNIGSATFRIGRAICRTGNSMSTALGRLSGETGANRILAGSPQSLARSLSLHARRRVVADRTAGAVAAFQEPPIQNVLVIRASSFLRHIQRQSGSDYSCFVICRRETPHIDLQGTNRDPKGVEPNAPQPCF